MIKESDFIEVKDSWRPRSDFSNRRQLTLWEFFPICMGRSIKYQVWTIEAGTWPRHQRSDSHGIYNAPYILTMHKIFSMKNVVNKINEYETHYHRNMLFEGMIVYLFSDSAFEKKLQHI